MPEPKNPPRLFLSYTRKDSANVKELYKKLKQAGYHPWMDIEDILPGQDWEQVMIEAINNAVFFLACLSSNSIDHRGVVQEEIKQALQVWRRKLDDDIYFIPVRLNECKVPDTLAKFNWVDLFRAHGFSRLLVAIRTQMERLGHVQKIPLRSKPLKSLSGDAVKTTLRKKGFFDSRWNRTGKGLPHQYEVVERNGKKFVVDHITDLMWEQGGTEKGRDFNEAQKHIQELNLKKQARYNDWRLPTLEEAMSLVEPEKKSNNLSFDPTYDNLYIDPIFDGKQFMIWTADQKASGKAWDVSFVFGCCASFGVDNGSMIRAVRHIRAPRATSLAPVLLRTQPLTRLSIDDVKDMLREKGFYSRGLNLFGKGLKHQYKIITRNGAKLVIDHTTGLMWQQGGSESLLWENIPKYIKQLNRKKFAGYSDWRLPTLEEAMSLMEPEKKSKNLYIDPIFNAKQQWMWTADNVATRVVWLVYFFYGSCNPRNLVDHTAGPVRAVHSVQSNI